MITVEVSVHVYSTVTGRTGNWTYSTRMEFVHMPRVGDQIVWGRPGHEINDQVRRVYFFETAARTTRQPGVAIELEPTKTDSPDILTELMELHKDWEQLGGPWEGQ